MHKKLTTILHFIKVYLILYYGVILVKRKSRRGYRIPKRIIVTGFLLLIEIAFIALFSAYITKDHYFTFALFEFLSVCCVVYLVNEKNEQSYKIAWIIFILGIPYAGWLFFLVVVFETTTDGGGRGLGVRLLAVRGGRSTTREKIRSVGRALQHTTETTIFSTAQ